MSRTLPLAAIAVLLTACSHELEVKNLQMYSTPRRMVATDVKPRVAVLPFSGRPDEIFYHNAVVDRLLQDPGISDLRTDYMRSTRSNSGTPGPDLIVSVIPLVDYRSSGWNFLINWPGFLIFTPAWNGYVYHADISTQVEIFDADRKVISSSTIPVSYSIRQAEMDRTIFTGLTWLEVSVLAFGGGIYNANVFDRDIVGGIEVHVKDNYANYMYGQIAPKIAAAADATMTPPATPVVEPSSAAETQTPATAPAPAPQ